jgi:P-type E1-E2 ATPase
MIGVDIPDFGKYDIDHLVFDFNGTLAEAGELIPGVQDVLNALARSVQVHVVTADTFGTAQHALQGVNCKIHMLRPDEQRHAKLAYVYILGPQHTITIGNGRNDVDMLSAAAVGIAVINAEGAAGEALVAADVVCNSIGDALSLLAERKRLVATLRA